jgi:hypothetical protein
MPPRHANKGLTNGIINKKQNIENFLLPEKFQKLIAFSKNEFF